MGVQVIGKKPENQRTALPNTVGKNSLFVKNIMERYGQGEGYRLDPASMVYLLPAVLPDTEEEKKEPEEGGEEGHGFAAALRKEMRFS